AARVARPGGDLQAVAGERGGVARGVPVVRDDLHGLRAGGGEDVRGGAVGDAGGEAVAAAEVEGDLRAGMRLLETTAQRREALLQRGRREDGDRAGGGSRVGPRAGRARAGQQQERGGPGTDGGAPDPRRPAGRGPPGRMRGTTGHPGAAPSSGSGRAGRPTRHQLPVRIIVPQMRGGRRLSHRMSEADGRSGWCVRSSERAVPYQVRSMWTFVDFTRAVASMPTSSPRSSTASRVSRETSRCGPAWISTWAATSPSLIAVTMPGKALRAEVYGVSSSAGAARASSTEKAARSRPSMSRRPPWSRWVVMRPASAQRRAVSGLTPSSGAAWPMV